MIKEILNNILLPEDDFVFGTADLHGLIDSKFNDFQYGVSIGKRLENIIIDAIDNGPTMDYYNHYSQTNIQLSKIAKLVKIELNRHNIESVIIEPSISTSSKEYIKHLSTFSYDVSHKMVATRSGLGWIGKTDLLISKKFGPRLRFVSLLINQKPEFTLLPINESKCGKCNICVEKCPAQAANGKLWNINIHRDEFFNAQSCRNKCAELAKERLNLDERVCGLCVSICPIGKKSR